MSNGQRIGLVLATVVVLVAAFFVLNPSGGGDSDDPPPTVAAPPPADTSTSGGETATVAPAPEPAAQPRPQYTKVRVRDGQPVGGIEKLEVKKGDRVRIEVSSPDTSDEIHLHGYDLKRDLEAGGRVRFSFEATAEGIFEIELEGAGVQIAELTVEPR